MRHAITFANPRLRLLRNLSVLVISVAAIAACGSSTANTGTKVSTSAGGSGGSTKTTGNQHFKVGDQVNVGNTYTVTVNSVTTSAGTADAISPPQAGNTYLIVDVSLKNTSSKSQDVSSLLLFTLKDSTGQKYDESLSAGVTTPDGTLTAGDVLRGQIAYEVPTSMHSFTLDFQADFTSSGATIWDLSV
jgi:hypothetical protein